MYFAVVVAICLVGQLYGMTTVPMMMTTVPGNTTHHHHHVHEANEFAQALFYYDALSHNMVMKLGTKCYIEKLKGSQRPTVHTDDGIEKLENNLMYLITKGDRTEMTHAEVMHLSPHVERMCAGQTVYQVTHHHHSHNHTSTVTTPIA